MVIESPFDFYKYSLFIFDLDNTIYNEEDYLFQAYKAISQKLGGLTNRHNKNDLFASMMEIYRKEGREKLFDKFLAGSEIDSGYIAVCLKILRSFNPEKRIEINPKMEKILRSLVEKQKQIFVLTNGNPEQQRNKIRNILWNGLDEKITFILANEIEPKPSPEGIRHILKLTGIKKDKTILIGDSEVDLDCASRGEIRFVNISDLAI
jgi:HAD superfamily hydrolase (TIGR01549 family)